MSHKNKIISSCFFNQTRIIRAYQEVNQYNNLTPHMHNIIFLTKA